MRRKRTLLYPKQARLLEGMGENLRLARLRRKLSAEMVAERADISRSTLYLLERGDPGVSLGNLMRVLAIFGMEKELGGIAGDDLLGRKIQDAGLPAPKKRAPKLPRNEE